MKKVLRDNKEDRAVGQLRAFAHLRIHFEDEVSEVRLTALYLM